MSHPTTQKPSSQLLRISHGHPASDGAGVQLTRYIGMSDWPDLDPFLMLDAFASENPDDYMAGFPPHPHRGFETVTYLLHGRMRHRDNLGNEGVLEAGGIQWMTAGRGVIHSEMPEQENGLLQGFQLWLNLPAHAKMTPPAYQDFPPDAIPLEVRDNGTRIRVISGQTDQGTVGVIHNPYVHPTYLDVTLPPHSDFHQAWQNGQQGFILMLEGQLLFDHGQTALKTGQLAQLRPPQAHEDGLQCRAAEDGARFLLVTATPLQEAIARGGPFVMNTQAEIQQAFDDYRHGRF
ncbi:MAG: pirin family protein [Hydrogenovibrio sp.]